jgi:hypothetical protein
VADDVNVDALIDQARAAGASDRKLRLFEVACVRQVWHLLDDPRTRAAVEVAERYADGGAAADELTTAHDVAGDAASERAGLHSVEGDARAAAGFAVCFACGAGEDAKSVASTVVCAMPMNATATERARKEQAALLACIVGPRPRSEIGLAWLTWNGGTVRDLARAAYQEPRLPEGTLDPARLAVLADALEDAGCSDAELLGHLRGPGPHVRGCWAVDLVLSKS